MIFVLFDFKNIKDYVLMALPECLFKIAIKNRGFFMSFE
jgi:hypothetical protein